MLTDPDGKNYAPAKSTKKKSNKKKSGKKKSNKSGSRGSSSSRSSKNEKWSDVLLGGRGISRTSTFWSRSSVRSGPHTGVDIGVPTGTSVYTPRSGKVVKSGWDGAFGNVVTVKMSDGNYLMFAHLSKTGVKVGDQIDAGTRIGRSGSTGNSTGPHLHIELRTKASGGKFGNRESWRFADPIKYLNSHGESVTHLPDGSGGGGGSSGGGGGSSYSSSSGGGGGGGGGGSYGYSKKDMYEYLDAMFGDVKILKQLDDQLVKKGEGKSIDWLIDTLVKKRITDATIAATYMAQTGFFKKYSVDIANRLVEEKQRPGVAKGDINSKRQTILSAMNAQGIHLSSAELSKLARDAWVYGWNDEQIGQKIATAKSVSLSGGQWAETQEDAVKYADDYGVTYSDALNNQLKSDYLNNRGANHVQGLMRDQAASKYSVFADQIQAGQATRALADGYFQQAAQLLEVDPDTLTWDDPLFRNGKAFTTTDANGKQAQRNLADFETMIKQDNRWMNTVNARDTISSGVYNLMARMGLAG